MVDFENYTERLNQAIGNSVYRGFKRSNIDLNGSLKKDGYHFKWRGVNYSLCFVYEENKIFFIFDASIGKENHSLETRIRRELISNRELNNTRYLAGQRLDIEGRKVNLRCRLKRNPQEDKDINNLCDLIWGQLVKRAMRGIYGE